MDVKQRPRRYGRRVQKVNRRTAKNCEFLGVFGDYWSCTYQRTNSTMPCSIGSCGSYPNELRAFDVSAQVTCISPAFSGSDSMVAVLPMARSSNSMIVR